ncbi:MAG: type I-E CRISPR-associated protein Cse2/CasB [Thermodesulfobacteriota bacterium]
MSQTPVFIARLTNERLFGPGERARLCALAGRGLDEDVAGFDLFTGLWWPLRERNQAAPRREIAWLVAKLYAAFPLRHKRCECGGPTSLAVILGREERRLPVWDRKRFRQRFDSLLGTPLSGLESHLRWAMSAVRDAITAMRSQGIDWVQLTNNLSIWDRGEEHRQERDIRDIWSEQYLEIAK